MKNRKFSRFLLLGLFFSTFVIALEVVEHIYDDVEGVNQRNVQNAIGSENASLPVGTERLFEFADGSREVWVKQHGAGSMQWFPVPGTFMQNAGGCLLPAGCYLVDPF